jgi:hypothetical protein
MAHFTVDLKDVAAQIFGKDILLDGLLHDLG